MSFERWVDEVHGLQGCSKPGLQALESSDRLKIQAHASRSLSGSVFIDECLRTACPHDPRWDYAVGYQDQVYFIEVHPASGGASIEEVRAKHNWLRARLQGTTLLSQARAFVWITSGKTSSSPRFARSRRALAKAGLTGPVSTLRLPLR